jgi:hypothetical protein
MVHVAAIGALDSDQHPAGKKYPHAGANSALARLSLGRCLTG